MAVAGYLVDRVGAPRLLVVGVTLIGGGFLITSQVQTLWQFYISLSVIAVGISFAGAPVCAVAIAHWFVKKRGRALGVMFAGAGASGIMVLLAALLIAMFDWRGGLMILGGVQLATCIPLALTVRHRPQEVGLLPDGGPSAEAGAPGDPQPESEGAGDGAATGQAEGLTLAEALRTRFFWLIGLALILAWAGGFAVVIHVIVYLDESGGFTEEGAAVIAMGIPAGSLVGRVGFGWVADYLSKRGLLAAIYLLQGLGVLVFAAVQSPWQAVIFLAVFAPAYGGGFPVLPAFLAEYFGLRAFGGIQGLVMAIAVLGSFAGPIFAGAVYDVVDSYRPAFLLLALTAAIGAGLILVAGRPRSWRAEAAAATEA